MARTSARRLKPTLTTLGDLNIGSRRDLTWSIGSIIRSSTWTSFVPSGDRRASCSSSACKQGRSSWRISRLGGSGPGPHLGDLFLRFPLCINAAHDSAFDCGPARGGRRASRLCGLNTCANPPRALTWLAQSCRCYLHSTRAYPSWSRRPWRPWPPELTPCLAQTYEGRFCSECQIFGIKII